MDFLAILVVAFPLAPLFTLLNNWMKIQLEAQILERVKWPVVEKVQGIFQSS
jgi:hypothetical protein